VTLAGIYIVVVVIVFVITIIFVITIVCINISVVVVVVVIAILVITIVVTIVFVTIGFVNIVVVVVTAIFVITIVVTIVFVTIVCIVIFVIAIVVTTRRQVRNVRRVLQGRRQENSHRHHEGAGGRQNEAAPVHMVGNQFLLAVVRRGGRDDEGTVHPTRGRRACRVHRGGLGAER
jgi:hypothetical protein